MIDPFTGGRTTDAASCGTGSPLWSERALAAFGDYRPSFIRMAAFATGQVTIREAQGRPPPTRLRRDAEALTFYAMVYGAPAGAELTLEIIAPNGRPIVDREVIMDSRKARQFSLVGRRTPDGGWPLGAYRGIARLDSAGKQTIRIATVIVE